jgi:uncharacterized cupredoxin-like copper-binding protein
VRPVRLLVVPLGVAVLSVSAACGGDGDSSTSASDRGTVVNIALGESGLTYFVRPDQATVEAGAVTFAVTNVGELTHESSSTPISTMSRPAIFRSTRKRTKRTSSRRTSSARPPTRRRRSFPRTRSPATQITGSRVEVGGAELTVDLAAGKYILLCNLSGHYTGGKQYAALTVA